MKKFIYTFLFCRILGWKIKSSLTENTKKCILLVAPHTSWFDFFIGVFTRGILKMEMNFVAKKELFVFLFNYYFEWMGGTPLNRSKNENKVDAIASIFQQKEIFRLAIAPEGTRTKVKDFKTGFYYISKKANVPIIPVVFDYENKEVRLLDAFIPTDDKEKDFEFLYSIFRGVKGKFPEKSFG